MSATSPLPYTGVAKPSPESIGKQGLQAYIDEALGREVLKQSSSRPGLQIIQSGRFAGQTKEQAAVTLRAEYVAKPNHERQAYEAKGTGGDLVTTPSAVAPPGGAAPAGAPAPAAAPSPVAPPSGAGPGGGLRTGGLSQGSGIDWVKANGPGRFGPGGLAAAQKNVAMTGNRDGIANGPQPSAPAAPAPSAVAPPSVDPLAPANPNPYPGNRTTAAAPAPGNSPVAVPKPQLGAAPVTAPNFQSPPAPSAVAPPVAAPAPAMAPAPAPVAPPAPALVPAPAPVATPAPAAAVAPPVPSPVAAPAPANEPETRAETKAEGGKEEPMAAPVVPPAPAIGGGLRTGSLSTTPPAPSAVAPPVAPKSKYQAEAEKMVPAPAPAVGPKGQARTSGEDPTKPNKDWEAKRAKELAFLDTDPRYKTGRGNTQAAAARKAVSDKWHADNPMPPKTKGVQPAGAGPFGVY